jgi:hypothetical protein
VRTQPTQRLTVTVLAQLGDRPGGGKFWATFRREGNLFGGQKTKSATQRRLFRLACESTATPVAGTSAGAGEFSSYIARNCNLVQSLADSETARGEGPAGAVTDPELRLGLRLLKNSTWLVGSGVCWTIDLRFPSPRKVWARRVIETKVSDYRVFRLMSICYC